MYRIYFNSVAAASTAGTPQRSRTVPRLLPRDDFFQDVYTLLYAQAPHGISCDKLSLLVKRKDYQNPPRFVKLPIEEPQSFLFDPRTNMLYAEWSSLRAKKNIGEQYSFRTGLLPTPIPAT